MNLPLVKGARFMKDEIRRSFRVFLTFPDETLLVAERQHWIILLPQLIVLSFLEGIFVIASIIIFSILLPFPTLIILSILTISAGFTFFIAKILVEWFFHIYIVTNRKILEFSYVPLSHFMVNDIILDQVRCTEIDVSADGILHDLLNIGDVTISFDRPTHQEEFHITQIHNPRNIGTFLACQLIHATPSHSNKSVAETWFKAKSDPKKYRMREDIISEGEFGSDQLRENRGGILYE